MAHSELFFLYCFRMEVTTCIIFEELPWFSYSKYQFIYFDYVLQGKLSIQH